MVARGSIRFVWTDHEDCLVVPERPAAVSPGFEGFNTLRDREGPRRQEVEAIWGTGGDRGVKLTSETTHGKMLASRGSAELGCTGGSFCRPQCLDNAKPVDLQALFQAAEAYCSHRRHGQIQRPP